MPSRALRRARRSVAATFLVHAAVSGTLAPRIPAIKANLGLSDGRLGIALTGFAVGLFVGTRLAAWLIDRVGSRAVIRVALPALCAALVGPALADGLVTLLAALAVLGVVLGLHDVAMNAQAVVVERGYRRPIMSSLHGIWSAGVLAASAIAAGFAALGAGVRIHFALAAVVLGGASVLAPLSLLPPAGDAFPLGRAGDRRSRRAKLQTAVVALGAIGFASFLGEGAAADWSGVYVRDRVGAGGGVAASAFTAFAVGMVVTRFGADRLSARFGPIAVVRAGGMVGALGLALALSAPEPASALAGFALLGSGLAPVVPLAFSAAGNLDPPTAAALGWVVTVSYVGSVLGPASIGAIAAAAGLRVGLLLPALLCGLIALLAPFARSAAGAPRVELQPI